MDPRTTALPAVDVLVPAYAEVDLIQRKLEDVAGLDYPRELLRVVVVDGGSPDGTASLASAWLAGAPFEGTCLVSRTRGKTVQLRTGLQACRAPWILVTDVDACLRPGTLRDLVGRALAVPDVGLVGAPVRPREAHPLDVWHWRFVNGLRRLESRHGSTGLVAGPCYLVRRDLLEALPEDVVGDDIFLTCRAAARGLRVEYAGESVVELRAPASAGEWFRHKHRKGSVYVRETLKFLGRVGGMRPWFRVAYAVRLALLLGLPLGTAALAAGAVLAARGLAPGAAAAGILALAAACVASRFSAGLRSLLWLLAWPPALALVLLRVWATLPFTRQTASYPKVSLSAGVK